MKKLTSRKVRQYVAWRSNQGLRHCPKALAEACNEACYEFSHNSGLDMLKLLLFNEHLPSLHTHNYGFHTATGRHIIDTIREYYYEYESEWKIITQHEGIR